MEIKERYMPEAAVEAKKRPVKVLSGMPEFLEMREGKEQLETDKFPQYLTINLETTCPLDCIKCAEPGCAVSRRMGPPLSLDERKKILDIAADIGVKELVIIGAGEPSVSKNFIDIVSPLFEAAHERGVGIVMFTTALGINKEQAEFFRDHDVTVVVSLDSLDPETYKYLTGGRGNLDRVLRNIQILRDTYKDTQEVLPDGRKLVRLGINVTIQKPNVDELDRIKEFAGDDMQFVANEPMPQGKFRIYKNWQELVGDKIKIFKRLAAEKSDTGRHSSIAEGVCSYFNRGVSVEVDGELLSCGYASASAHHFGNVREGVSPQSLLEHYQMMRGKYIAWCEKIGRKPSCPLRDDDYEDYIHSLESGKS